MTTNCVEHLVAVENKTAPVALAFDTLITSQLAYRFSFGLEIINVSGSKFIT